MVRTYYLILFACFFAIQNSNAQFWFLGQNGNKSYDGAPFKPHSSVSFGLGSGNYIGDLAPLSGLSSVIVQTTRWNLGFQYTRHLKKNFSAKINLSYIRIAGDDNYFKNTGTFEPNYYRNLHFSNDIKELAVLGVYEIQGNPENVFKRAQLSPYVYAGIAGFAHSPEARGSAGRGLTPVQAGWISLQEKENEGVAYSLINVAIPLGIGFRYKLGKLTDIGIDIGYRFTLSDYLDDVSDGRFAMISPSSSTISNRSTEYFAASTLVDRKPYLFGGSSVPTSSSPKIQSGNDSYFTTQIQLIFHIRNKIDCPPLPN